MRSTVVSHSDKSSLPTGDTPTVSCMPMPVQLITISYGTIGISLSGVNEPNSR